MTKRFAVVVGALVLGCLAWFGCEEQPVGAPCIPETDKGDFSASLSGTTWSIETRSVQCETQPAVCLTKTAPTGISADQVAACEAATAAAGNVLEECWQGDDGATQVKYSFCSCRCKDINGNTYNKNPDKYDYLCECPPNTKCVEVLGDIQEAPSKVKGSYCVPNCIASGECYPQDTNDDGEVENYSCAPSKDSEKPWQWKCMEFDTGE